MTVATLRVREPLGERNVAPPVTLGTAAEATIRVPAGAAAAEAVVQIEVREQGSWYAVAAADAEVVLNGERLSSARELRSGDVIAVGDAQALVAFDHDGAITVDVRHMVGNPTLPPLRGRDARAESEDGRDSEIIAAVVDLSAASGGARRGAMQPPAAVAPPRSRRGAWAAAGVTALALALVFGVLGRLQRVAIEVEPSDARVVADSALSWYSSSTLFLLPGQHRVRAERAGYQRAEQRVTVTPGRDEKLKLRLALLPGVLAIDTGGVSAKVTVDGAPAGNAPGDVSIAAGSRTLTLRADRYLDIVQPVKIEGGGVRQALAVKFQTSWGKLAVSATVPGAVLTLAEGTGAPTALPATLDLPAGLQRLRVSAAGTKSWDSTVLVKAGETTTLGPLELGAPDAVLVARSRPAGAEVSVAGVYRGRTPLELPLSPGAEYDVVIALAGHGVWQRRVQARPDVRIVLDAALAPILVDVAVRGEPAEADLFVDGVARGKTPAAIKLTATRHRLEVRRAGAQTFATDVDLTPALARSVEYTLSPEGRAPGWKPPTATSSGKLGIAMRLVAPGTFTMGSERREQGRRPNEALRQVTLTRPVYLAARELSNAEFRRFRPTHASGFVDKRSVDLDVHAVTGVSWPDAVAYCNWASEQEGLPAAYEQKDGNWILKSPVATGYRLPTEAEWEFAARGGAASAATALRRFTWGDALPPPPNSGNVAGREARLALQRVLDDWVDDYDSVAPPGKFPAAPAGFFDLFGNVSEWVHDTYTSVPDGSPATDPTGPSPGPRHVVKGSNWRTAAYAELRLAWRAGADAATQDIGFRVARYAD